LIIAELRIVPPAGASKLADQAKLRASRAAWFFKLAVVTYQTRNLALPTDRSRRFTAISSEETCPTTLKISDVFIICEGKKTLTPILPH
jgi:hypothetical protein